MIRGFADLHNHQFSHLGFGGLAFHGLPFGAAATVLPHCDVVHGPGGTGDHIAQAMSLFSGRLALGHLVGGSPEFDGWPRWDSFTHQMVYEDWLKRAVDGGLRLMVMLAVNSEPLATQATRALGRTADDMEAVDLQLMAAKSMETFIDGKSGGNGLGWYRIVRTPDEARVVMEAGKLAVVLGIEVDALFGCKKATDLSEAGLRQRLDDYYQAGVRHLFPIHFVDNGFGGTAFQNLTEFDPNFPSLSPVNPLPGGMAPNPVTTADCTASGYQDRQGRCNTRGLTGLGMTMIIEMIARGMIIDVDHMSARSRADTLSFCEAVEYPVVSGHTGFVDIGSGSKSHEGQLTGPEVDRIRRSGGLVCCIVQQGDVGQISTFAASGQAAIPHTCGNTSNTWIQAYRYAASRGGGGAVGFGTDFNGFAGLPGPRFGPERCPGGQSGAAPTNRVIYPFVVAATGATMPESVVGQKTFTINDDGLAHVGMLPDFIADLQVQGVSAAELEPLLASADAYVTLWERAHAHRAGRLLAADPALAAGRTSDDLSALAGGVPVLGAPAVVVSAGASGELVDVFARGRDEHLHRWSRMGAGSWTQTDITAALPPGAYPGPGRPLGPFLVTSDPAAALGPDGLARVYARGPAGQLLTFAPGASGWAAFDDAAPGGNGTGVSFVGAPAVVRDGAGTVHVVARLAAGRLVVLSEASAPAPVRPRTRGTVGPGTGTVTATPLPGSWTFAPFDIGTAAGDPQVVSTKAGLLVVVRGE